MNDRVMIIAEAGVNHNGSLELAKQLIDTAADAGADFVKFQTFKTEQLVSRHAPKAAYQKEAVKDGDDSQFNMLKKLELSEKDHYVLKAYAEKSGIRFLSTAFDLGSIDFLGSLGLPLFKIPSGEITNYQYLKKIASKAKPVVLSTGMANLCEIEGALEILTSCGLKIEDVTVLHCSTEYPVPFENVNLNAMRTIGQAFGVKYGYSDHTTGIEIPVAAVALGAVVIEKHFTLDKSMEGPDHKASLDPKELKDMITSIRNIERAMGDGIKRPSPAELANKTAARKSIHLASELTKGHILTEQDLVAKRPGDGISPLRIADLVGAELRSGLPSDHKLSFNDLILK